MPRKFCLTRDNDRQSLRHLRKVVKTRGIVLSLAVAVPFDLNGIICAESMRFKNKPGVGAGNLFSMRIQLCSRTQPD